MLKSKISAKVNNNYVLKTLGDTTNENNCTVSF